MNRSIANKKGRNRPHIWKTITKRAGITLLSLVIFSVLFVLIVRSVTYFSNHINTADGIDEGIYVSLGGQEQYLLIRGESTANPVLIWLHGGPASPDSYANYAFQQYLVDEYTVVNWDQRGCGRTYYRNQAVDPNNESTSFEQATTDLDELVDYLTDRFYTDKVILVGHSYGTLLGSSYALSHPDKVAAYIGIGQFVSLESELYSYEDALQKATAKGDDTSDLENAYRQYTADMTLVNMMRLRSLVSKYHPAEKEAGTLWLGIASPYMGLNDLRWFMKQLGSLDNFICLNQSLFDYILDADVQDHGMQYQIPVGFISGSDDWITPVAYSTDYFNAISAPMKDFTLITGCGHSPQYDSPVEFCDALKEMLSDFLALS